MHRIVRGQRRPPLDQIEAWATALRLEGDRREAFIDEAHLDHATERVRTMVMCLQTDLGQMRAQRRTAADSAETPVYVAAQRPRRYVPKLPSGG